MKAITFFSLLFFSALSFGLETSEQSPRLLIHLLDYIALDYPGAVQNHKVVSKAEYDEQKEFAKAVRQINSHLAETKNAAGIDEDLKKLITLVESKADSEKVAKAARDVKWKIIGVAGIQLAPSSWPNLHKGKLAFEKNCAACHGNTGHGDGPSGNNLDPKPSNFHDGEKMAKLPPFQAFNVIRLGLPGTAMAGFPQFSDNEVWDLAFYVVSLRHRTPEAQASATSPGPIPGGLTLQQVATQPDEELVKLLPGSEADKARELAKLRVRSQETEDSKTFLELARNNLQEALTAYKAGQFDAAKRNALVAYLSGIEPVEPRIRASDSALFVEIEERMMSVRTGIDNRVSGEALAALVANAETTIQKVDGLFDVVTSPAMTFSVSAGIVIREAFEAILLLITLLGVIRSLGFRKAALAVHAGWIGALSAGFAFWMFSGWVMKMSGAQRELLEGVVSLFAVAVVLYMGFWLHRKAEIGRWRAFINEMTENAVSGNKLIALAGISFMAVFREAFETVIFLRAVLLESGGTHQTALAAGVFSALILVVILATALTKFSAKLPIRQLFDFSSIVMVVLAFILMGKALHSFQETGLVPITEFPLGLRFDLVGIYPTYETLVPQVVILTVSLIFWLSGRRPSNLQGQRA